MNAPSWYDLLGVAPDADADEVRAAWRAAVADLDPTDRRFAPLSRAAEVLLDPQQRAAYDADLAAGQREDQADDQAGDQAEDQPEDPAEDQPAAEQAAAERAEERHEPSREPRTGQGSRRVVPGWLLVGVGVLALLFAGAAAVVAATVPSDREAADAARQARAAAERAVVPLLSYDASDLEGSRAAASAHLTGDYRKEYDRLFEGVIDQNATNTGTVVRAEVVRAGLVRVDGERAQVFVLVDQTRTNKAEKRPVVYKNWATVSLERVDGEWLVAGLET